NARNAHKIGIGAGTPGAITIFVATDCGLVKSTDSGTTWTNVSPNGVGNSFNDVKLLGTGPNFTVDACGTSGFFRSTNGGSTFAQNSLVLGSGTEPCRIATAPGNSSIILLSSFVQTPPPSISLCQGQLLESDDGGTSFTNLNPTNDDNCRI